MKKYALGIDIGGTSVKMLLVGEDCRIAGRSAIPCDAGVPWRKMLGRVTAAAGDLSGNARLVGAGVGCAGLVDPEEGVMRFSPTFPRWRNVPLGAFMEERLGVPCIVDNDANMVMLGEHRCGAARGARNAVCLTLGTGVGGGIIVDGALRRGGTMCAGELGHIPVEPRGIPCPCGGRGCLERYVGAAGLVRLARRAMHGRRSSMRGRNTLGPIEIEKAARAGDAAARLAWERAGRCLGTALVTVVNVLDPDVIVIGGGISRAGSLLLKPALRVVRERALRIPARHAGIVLSTLGGDAGPIGAASEILARSAA